MGQLLGSSRGAAEATLRVHVRARGGAEASAGFGLHVWGSAAASTTSWETPLTPAGRDWFGPYFDVALAAEPRQGGAQDVGEPALGLLLHRGEEKGAQAELVAAEATPGELWLGHAAAPAREEPQASQVPCGDLGALGARAHWLTERLVAWRAAAGAAPGSKFWLHCSAAAALEDAGSAGIVGADSDAGPYELIVLEGSLTEHELWQSHPYLAGCALLRVPDSADARALCKRQLAVSMVASSGEATDCTGVQVGALLDQLFKYDGPLGCTPQGEGLSLALWAPTAVMVEAVWYAEPRGPELSTAAMAAGADGVWRLEMPKSSWGQYYTYRVQAYHPQTGKMETMSTPDPYSRASSADSGRTLACHMPGWADALPKADSGAWWPRARPPLADRRAAVVYELHVRDFSATDATVPPELRGKYLAFAQEGTCGDRHLRKLADAGVTHVQLLPTYDFGSVPERVEDRTEPAVPAGAAADSELPQAAVEAVKDVDGFNWGYDPVLYDVPEGSYATDPDGVARVCEHRTMVAALHKKGLRVVLDVVYNHTLGSGPSGPHSVLDKCVPGYYHRRSEAGAYENSTCMNNTAAERLMMERLVVDSVVHWAKEYGIDGFRFDLFGHLPLRCIQKCRDALDALTLEKDGVPGKELLLHGEGWEFGEVAGGQRGPMATQHQLAGTGVGSFNDRVRDAVLGGSPFADPRTQGFATGLALRPWPSDAGVDQGSASEQARGLLVAADKIRLSLAGSLRDFKLSEDCDGNSGVPACDAHGGGVAYTGSPGEAINYVSAHDNETLYDNTVWKMPPTLFSPEERMRANWLCSAVVVLAHGVPFLHAGDEVLRSKSLDRDSYNSGDWFNALDFSGRRSTFGVGLPPQSKNGEKWDLMRPLLADATLRPTSEMAAATTAKFLELLRVRRSTPLIGLLSRADVMEKVDFPCCGVSQPPGVIAMQTRNGPPAEGPAASEPLCPHLERVLVVFSARLEEARLPAPPGGRLRLHPLQAASQDPVTCAARFDAETNELVVPAQAAAVFVETLPGKEGWSGE